MRTVAWLKEQLKHLPDHLPVVVESDRIKMPLLMVSINHEDRVVTLFGAGGDSLADQVKVVLGDKPYQKIAAVKFVRDSIPGMGLKEAKEYVERLMEEMG